MNISQFNAVFSKVWVFGFNGKVQILAPESVKEQYKQMIAQADEGMQEKGNKEQEM